MTRLTRRRIVYLKNTLTNWQTPKEMFNCFEATRRWLGSGDFYGQSGLAFLRDAYVASQFGLARKARSVRLVADDWPDFEIRTGQGVECFEAVQADDNDRVPPPGLEYQKLFSGFEGDQDDNITALFEQYAEWLRVACERKVNKDYGVPTNLVVYLNAPRYGASLEDVEQYFAPATAVTESSFDTAWVLWGDSAYCFGRAAGRNSAPERCTIACR